MQSLYHSQLAVTVTDSLKQHHIQHLQSFLNHLVWLILFTWFSKVPEWIVAHHPTVVGQEMAHLVWLVQQLHFLVQSHVLIGEGEIPDRKMETWHYGCPGDVNVVQLGTLCVKALHVRQRII